MPALVAGFHMWLFIVDGRDKPGHDASGLPSLCEDN